VLPVSGTAEMYTERDKNQAGQLAMASKSLGKDHSAEQYLTNK
jgi:phosphatidate phosphatase PAH1